MEGNQKLWIIILLILAVIGGFYFYNTSTNNEVEEPLPQNTQDINPPVTQEPQEEEAMEDDSMEEDSMTEDSETENEEAMTEETTTVDLESGNYFFDPAEITVSEGSVTITNTANSGTHTFVIDELGVREELETGKEFTFEAEAGTYAFYCDIGNHRALGMEGTLTVE